MITRAYIADTGALRNEETFNRLITYVSTERRTKIDRCAKRKDKILSLAAGLLLETALSDAGVADRTIIVGDNGKPYLASGEIFFNLSHSGDRVMCAVSDREVGCDVQQTGEINLKIADRFFSPDEKMFLDSITDENEKIDVFFRLWTLKESYIKMLGTGLKMPLKSFSVSFFDDVPVFAEKKNKYRFKEYSTSDNYKYAVCTESSSIADKVTVVEIG